MSKVRLPIHETAFLSGNSILFPVSIELIECAVQAIKGQGDFFEMASGLSQADRLNIRRGLLSKVPGFAEASLQARKLRYSIAEWRWQPPTFQHALQVAAISIHYMRLGNREADGRSWMRKAVEIAKTTESWAPKVSLDDWPGGRFLNRFVTAGMQGLLTAQHPNEVLGAMILFLDNDPAALSKLNRAVSNLDVMTRQNEPPLTSEMSLSETGIAHIAAKYALGRTLVRKGDLLIDMALSDGNHEHLEIAASCYSQALTTVRTLNETLCPHNDATKRMLVWAEPKPEDLALSATYEWTKSDIIRAQNRSGLLEQITG